MNPYREIQGSAHWLNTSLTCGWFNLAAALGELGKDFFLMGQGWGLQASIVSSVYTPLPGDLFLSYHVTSPVSWNWASENENRLWCYRCVMQGTFWQCWHSGTSSDDGIWSRAQECVRFNLRYSRSAPLFTLRLTALKLMELESLTAALNLCVLCYTSNKLIVMSPRTGTNVDTVNLLTNICSVLVLLFVCTASKETHVSLVVKCSIIHQLFSLFDEAVQYSDWKTPHYDMRDNSLINMSNTSQGQEVTCCSANIKILSAATGSI